MSIRNIAVRLYNRYTVLILLLVFMLFVHTSLIQVHPLMFIVWPASAWFIIEIYYRWKKEPLRVFLFMATFTLHLLATQLLVVENTKGIFFDLAPFPNMATISYFVLGISGMLFFYDIFVDKTLSFRNIAVYVGFASVIPWGSPLVVEAVILVRWVIDGSFALKTAGMGLGAASLNDILFIYGSRNLVYSITLFYTTMALLRFTELLTIRGERERDKKRLLEQDREWLAHAWENPLFSYILCTVSPLTHDARNTETAMELARHKAPIIFACESISGGTAPVTLGGTLVLQNAEVLSANVIAQLTNPGTPVIYGAVSSPMDMRNGSIVMGVPEVALLGVAVTQIAQYYGIPLYSMAGISDSKIPDAQTAYEKALQQVLVGLTGGNLIHNAAGMLDKMITGSLEQMVIDDEIIGMVKRIMRGIEINTDTLATDIIDKVGPGGNFLGEKHTRKHYQSEHDLSTLSDRLTREAWEKKGSKDVVQRVKEVVKQRLESHKVEPLDREVVEMLKKIATK